MVSVTSHYISHRDDIQVAIYDGDPPNYRYKDMQAWTSVVPVEFTKIVEITVKPPDLFVIPRHGVSSTSSADSLEANRVK